MIFIILLKISLVFAEVSTSDLSAAISADFYKDQQNSKVFHELKCLRNKEIESCKKEKRICSAIASDLALQNMIKIAPFLQQVLDSYGVSSTERALFFSQVLVESAYFTKFSETKNFSTNVGSSERSSNDMAITSIIEASNDDDAFKTKSATSQHSSQFGDFRGKGLIQITGCANFLSINHYLNLRLRGKPAEWKSYWYASEQRPASEDSKIGLNCSLPQEREKLAKMVTLYGKENPDMDLNLYGSIDFPLNYALPGVVLKDSKFPYEMSGERFMIESSMAYWRGKCGKTFEQILARNPTFSSTYCSKNVGTNKQEKISYCATKCIKGSSGTWQERHKNYLSALSCQQ